MELVLLEQYFTPYHTATAVSGQRIAILAPHPDDEVFGCGASACKWQEQGRVVQAFILTQGVVAGEFANQVNEQALLQDKIHKRQQESRAAAQCLNVPEPIFLTGLSTAGLPQSNVSPPEELLDYWLLR